MNNIEPNPEQIAQARQFLERLGPEGRKIFIEMCQWQQTSRYTHGEAMSRALNEYPGLLPDKPETTTDDQPKTDPPYNRLELIFAMMLVHGPRKAICNSEEKFGHLIMQFLTCDGPEHIERRMAAVACANEEADSPIVLQKVEMPEHMIKDLKIKLEAGITDFKPDKPRQ